MKPRIFFVDDEPDLLELYQMVFEPMRADWDIECFSTGREALDAMNDSPPNVIVSDMRMPEMSGAQLLNEVMRQYPKTTRIILSGYADQQQILTSLGATHQWLAKPCDLRTLRSTLTRVCVLDRHLLDQKIKEVAAQLESLPSLPILYFELLNKLQNPDASIEEIAGLISKNIGLVPKLLQLVNSAFFGIPRKVASVSEALGILGTSTVRTLLFSAHIFSCFDQKDFGKFQLEPLWSHSVQTALKARAIAQREQPADGQMAEEAFTAGLLHDIGKLLLAKADPGRYEKAITYAREKQLPDWQAERELIGTTHADLGAYLFGLWGLPLGIVEAVAWHHEPARRTPLEFSSLTTVHAADAFVEDTTPHDGARLDLNYLAELELTEKVSLWKGT
jgi:putative nucleotidyltransferase with HDIG domain